MDILQHRGGLIGIFAPWRSVGEQGQLMAQGSDKASMVKAAERDDKPSVVASTADGKYMLIQADSLNLTRIRQGEPITVKEAIPYGRDRYTEVTVEYADNGLKVFPIADDEK